MTDEVLRALLAGNADHVESLSADHFAAVEDGQRPPVVSVCCSDSRVSQEGMWNVREPGWLFTPSNIGNQAWDHHEGELVVDGSVLYPIAYTGTRVAVVVGHTGCGAVTAALESVRDAERGKDGNESADSAPDVPPGVRKWVETLVPVVERGLADPRVDATDDAALVDQLVEYNVDEQVTFLRESDAVPDDVRTYGFVYDIRQSYGDRPGRAYLVNAAGETDPATVREVVPEEFEPHVRRLL